MSSHARLTGTKVWHILQAIRICARALPCRLHPKSCITHKVLSSREERGGSLSRAGEAKFIFNAERRTERRNRLSVTTPTSTEECMICEYSGGAFHESERTALFHSRCRAPPPLSVCALADWGWNLPGGNEVEPRLRAARVGCRRPDAEMLQTSAAAPDEMAMMIRKLATSVCIAVLCALYFDCRYPDLTLAAPLNICWRKIGIRQQY